MALSRFTPWFAVSALMPLGSSSTHSFHLDFKNINVMLRLSYLFSFIHHLKFMHIFCSTNNACLFAAPSIYYSVKDIGKSNTTYVLSSNTEDISNKGQDLRLYDILCGSSLTSF